MTVTATASFSRGEEGEEKGTKTFSSMDEHYVKWGVQGSSLALFDDEKEEEEKDNFCFKKEQK